MDGLRGVHADETDLSWTSLDYGDWNLGAVQAFHHMLSMKEVRRTSLPLLEGRSFFSGNIIHKLDLECSKEELSK